MLIGAVLVEPEAEVSFRDGLILHDTHVRPTCGVRSPAGGTFNVSMELRYKEEGTGKGDLVNYMFETINFDCKKYSCVDLTKIF